MLAERILISGNEAVARSGIVAGCKHFFAYPITPQTEIAEYMARELPKIGGTFLQVEGEYAAIYMIYAGGLTGERVMTASSGCGFALMGEGISYMRACEVPGVLIDVARLGPGIGTGGQQGQSDYRLAVHGGGNGGYHCIVLAPYSGQESFDLVQLAFYLADKYRILVIVLTDFILGRMEEPVELRPLDFGLLPPKDWALRGKAQRGGRRSHFRGGQEVDDVVSYFVRLNELYQKIAEEEIRFETYKADDARLLVIAYGSSARIATRAVDLARDEGFKVGLLRPITLWPFPEGAIREAALQAGKVLVVEDCEGQFVDDVRAAVQGRVLVHLLGIWGRNIPGASGVIHPERVLQEVKSLV